MSRPRCVWSFSSLCKMILLALSIGKFVKFFLETKLAVFFPGVSHKSKGMYLVAKPKKIAIRVRAPQRHETCQNMMTAQIDAETSKVPAILLKKLNFQWFFLTLQTFKLNFLKTLLSHFSTSESSSKAKKFPTYGRVMQIVSHLVILQVNLWILSF